MLLIQEPFGGSTMWKLSFLTACLHKTSLRPVRFSSLIQKRIAGISFPLGHYDYFPFFIKRLAFFSVEF
jgi:hypothetical protein